MKILIRNADIIQSGKEAAIRGCITIEGNIIKTVGAEPKDFFPEKVIDGQGFVAMPGLINAHTHSAMGIFRNMADDLSFGDWLFGNIIPAENKLSEDDVYWGTLLGVAEMIKSGTTCFADMYLHIDSAAHAICQSKIRANLSYGPITSAARGGCLTVDTERFANFTKKWNNANSGLIKTSMEIHSVYLFDRPSIEAAAAFAQETESMIHIHLSESASELEMSKEKYGMSPIEAAYEMGIFQSPVLGAHCVYLRDRDIEILKEAGASPVHCPSSNLKLGNGVAPMALLMNLGLNVCIGTDGAASNNNLNILEEIHLAALLHKGMSKDPQTMPAGATIEMATENGARALGFHSLGRIAPGNKADIILINTNKPHLCPVNDIKAAVVYSAQAADVDTVIVDGNILMEGRRLTILDEELIMSKVKEIVRRIKG